MRVDERLFTREFRRFATVGGIGFCVDGGLLTILMALGWNIFPARSLSFAVAVTATWILNRLWTFPSGTDQNLRREYTYYFGTQAMGAAINLAVFFLLLKIYPEFRHSPLLPLALGAAVSLAFNYFVSKKLVFKR